MGKINQKDCGFTVGLMGGMFTGFLSTGVIECLTKTPTERLLGLCALPICGLAGMASGLIWDGKSNRQSETEALLNQRLGEKFSVEIDGTSAHAQIKGLHGVNRFTVDLATATATLVRGHVEHLLYAERVKHGRSYRLESQKKNAVVWDDSASYSDMNNLQKDVVEVMRDTLGIGQPASHPLHVEAPLLRYLNSEISVPMVEVSKLNEVLFLPPGPTPDSAPAQ